MKSPLTCTFVSTVALACLAACDVDVFGVSEKKIAGGCRLYVGETRSDFAVFAPGASSGPGVTQVGWRKPYIIARTNEGDWEFFDTSSGSSDSLSDEELQADPRLREIPVMSPQVAWDRLNHYRSQW